MLPLVGVCCLLSISFIVLFLSREVEDFASTRAWLNPSMISRSIYTYNSRSYMQIFIDADATRAGEGERVIFTSRWWDSVREGERQGRRLLIPPTYAHRAPHMFLTFLCTLRGSGAISRAVLPAMAWGPDGVRRLSVARQVVLRFRPSRHAEARRRRLRSVKPSYSPFEWDAASAAARKWTTWRQPPSAWPWISAPSRRCTDGSACRSAPSSSAPGRRPPALAFRNEPLRPPGNSTSSFDRISRFTLTFVIFGNKFYSEYFVGLIWGLISLLFCLTAAANTLSWPTRMLFTFSVATTVRGCWTIYCASTWRRSPGVERLQLALRLRHVTTTLQWFMARRCSCSAVTPETYTPTPISVIRMICLSIASRLPSG